MFSFHMLPVATTHNDAFSRGHEPPHFSWLKPGWSQIDTPIKAALYCTRHQNLPDTLKRHYYLYFSNGDREPRQALSGVRNTHVTTASVSSFDGDEPEMINSIQKLLSMTGDRLRRSSERGAERHHWPAFIPRRPAYCVAAKRATLCDAPIRARFSHVSRSSILRSRIALVISSPRRGAA